MARATVAPIVRRRWHDKAKLHVVGQLIVSSGSYETEISVGDLILVSGEYRSVSSITSNLVCVVSSAFSNNSNDRTPKRFDRLTTLTGSIDTTASASVTGVSTLFLTEVSVGDYLVIGTSTVGEARQVVSITSNTALTVASAFSDLANDASPQICKINGTNGRPDWTQLTGEIDPAASTTVTGINTKFLGDGLSFDFSGSEIFSRSAPIWMDIRSIRSGLTYNLAYRERLQDLTGTVDTAASVTVPGSGTLFLSELKVGDEILVGTERRFVTAIASDTSLTVNQAHTDQANDTTPQKVVRDPQIYDARLQIKGLAVTGSAAAAGTKALYVSGNDLVKEEAANIFGRLANLQTAAVPAIVLDDYIEFHAVFDFNG
jgi:hypothetical protein